MDGHARNEGVAAAISDLYSGPLDSFVARRDAFVKELRAAGGRENALAVKGLRKPSRLAWALNAASLADPARMDQLEAAVASTIQAQAGGGDLRSALSALREAVRGVADAAAGIAATGGHPMAPEPLANAIMAVIGASDAFRLLRTGHSRGHP